MQIVKVSNPFNLAKSEVFNCLATETTINRLVEIYQINNGNTPFICLVNGDPVLRAEWNSLKIRSNDHIAFINLLQGGGGGGSNPLRVVGMVALVVATVASYGAASAAWGTVWGATVAAGVSIGGGMLINALVPPPKPTLNGTSYTVSSQSPTYSLQAQGNQARLGNPIPVIYGRHLVYPDFASQPYYEYIDNEQYVYQLHCIGQGEYDIEKIMIEDTPISSFKEITYEILPPNTKNTMFAEDVVTSTEISGQELLKDEIIGPFILNPSETTVSKIGIDVAFQRGLYYANDNGSMSDKSVNWKVEARKIDDEDNALGEWFVLGQETFSSNSHNAIYKTYNYDVENARYEVRATRLDEKDTSSRAGHEIRWTSAKGFINAEHEYGNVTMIALKMQATNNLSQRSSRLLNCVVTRKLPQWTPEKGWSEPVPTNSIAWALADVLKAEYGAKLDDSRIDLDTLLYLDGIWQSRGDTFNAVFDSKLTVFEALSRIAKCGRAVAFLQGGIVRFVRDEPKTIPVALFSPRNIIKNSLSIQYIMPSEDTADSVTVEYFSDKTWKTTEITGVLPESTSENTATVELFGCTNKEQALREALYMAAANRYRRRIVSFMTELDGLIPTYGDLVAITHDMPSWGQGGEVIQKDGNKLTLSEPVTFSDNSVHYIALRKANGQLSGPYIVTSGNLENEVVLEETPDFEIYTGTSRERTHFAFGPADKWATMARIIGIKPRTNTVEITAVIEDERVHLN